MKEVVLKKYRTAFTKDLLLAAAKTPVRECDETNPGEYVAYVDEGDDTWDVAVTVDREKGVVTAHSCECSDKAAICKHRVALIAHIADGMQTATVKKVAKAPKRDVLANLVQETPADALREWLLPVLRRNKDLQLAFTHQFAAMQTSYTPADAHRMVTDVVKSVLGKKKKADAVQVKKMVELWGDILKPIVTYYQNAVMDEQVFLVFDSMVSTCQYVVRSFDTSSTRVQKYIEEVLSGCVAVIDGLQDESLWQRAAGFYADRVVNKENLPDGAYMHLLKALMEVSSAARREVLATMLMKDAAKKIQATAVPGKYQLFLLEMLVKADVFALFCRVLKPVTHENTYNTVLIQALIDIDDLELAEAHCNKVIATNYYAEFNVPYWLLLRDIYTRMGARSKQLGVMMELTPYSWNFADFIAVYDNLQPEQQKSWRRKMQIQAVKLAASNNRLAIRFLFDEMAHERNFPKMLSSIDSRTPFDVLVRFFDELERRYHKELLPILLGKSTDYGWGAPDSYETEDREQYPILFDLLPRRYTHQELSAAIKTIDSVRRWRTPFLIYVVDRLSNRE